MRQFVIAVLTLVAIAGCSGRRNGAYTFTELAYPGAKGTVASGINGEGDVVGWYEKGNDTYAFLYKQGQYSSIEFPGAGLTQLTGISDNGEMAGAYRLRDEKHPLAYHGFVLTKAHEFRQVAHPEYQYGMAMRVLADGTVIGCVHKENMASMRAVTIPATAITADGVTPAAVTLLDAAGSMHNGGTPDGTKLVGVLAERGDAYVVDRGALTTLRAPNATRTEAWDVNRAGTIVGVFVDAQSISHGFVLENGRYTTIDAPGAKHTVVFGINANGEIVGSFETADGQRRAYRATAK